MNARTDLVTLVQRLPRVLLHLLHAETDSPRPGIDTQYFDVNRIARVNNLARMLDALGPAHFRNVDQTFDSVFEFDKGAIIRHAGDFSINSRADWKTLFDAGPWIRKELLVTQRDTLALAIKLQHLDLNVVADTEQLVRIL